jgi:DNA-binding response OmpR family regulator
MNSKANVLIIDDNPVHLEIYRLIVEKAGFVGLPALVTLSGLEFPERETVHAVLLDYRLAPNISAYEVALKVRGKYPTVPIVILSDMYDPPADTARLVQGFVRKGNPEKLLSTLGELTRGPE